MTVGYEESEKKENIFKLLETKQMFCSRKILILFLQ